MSNVFEKDTNYLQQIELKNNRLKRDHVKSIDGDTIIYKKSDGTIEQRSLIVAERESTRRLDMYTRLGVSEQIHALFTNIGIDVVATGVVGSFAYGTPKPESDLDILVLVDTSAITSLEAIRGGRIVQTELEQDPTYSDLQIDIRVVKPENL